MGGGGALDGTPPRAQDRGIICQSLHPTWDFCVLSSKPSNKFSHHVDSSRLCQQWVGPDCSAGMACWLSSGRPAGGQVEFPRCLRQDLQVKQHQSGEYNIDVHPFNFYKLYLRCPSWIAMPTTRSWYCSTSMERTEHFLRFGWMRYSAKNALFTRASSTAGPYNRQSGQRAQHQQPNIHMPFKR